MTRIGPRARALATALSAAVAVAIIGGLATEIGPWYAGLRKPSWQPPDWLFGPAWTVIYAFTVVAAARAWERAATRVAREGIVTLFAANAFVNVLWSLLFFRLHRPDWALLDVGVLWSSILALVVVVGRIDRTSGALLVPYLAWVSFAAFLNLTIVELNAPFAGSLSVSIALLVDIVLAVFVLESLALLAWSLKRKAMPFVRLVPTLLAGVFLVIAMRAVVHQAAWSLVALWLLAAGAAHAADLTIRLRR